MADNRTQPYIVLDLMVRHDLKVTPDLSLHKSVRWRAGKVTLSDAGVSHVLMLKNLGPPKPSPAAAVQALCAMLELT